MARYHEESSSILLILAHVDHACGDVIASVIQRLCGLAVQNVNLVPSFIKKGHPCFRVLRSHGHRAGTCCTD